MKKNYEELFNYICKIEEYRSDAYLAAYRQYCIDVLERHGISIKSELSADVEKEWERLLVNQQTQKILEPYPPPSPYLFMQTYHEIMMGLIMHKAHIFEGTQTLLRVLNHNNSVIHIVDIQKANYTLKFIGRDDKVVSSFLTDMRLLKNLTTLVFMEI